MDAHPPRKIIPSRYSIPVICHNLKANPITRWLSDTIQDCGRPVASTSSRCVSKFPDCVLLIKIHQTQDTTESTDEMCYTVKQLLIDKASLLIWKDNCRTSVRVHNFRQHAKS